MAVLRMVTRAWPLLGWIALAGGCGRLDQGHEWVAEQDSGVAHKRGSSGCDDASAHEIFVDPYGSRV